MSRQHPPSHLLASAPRRPGDLIIRQKTEAMIQYVYTTLRHWPKAERHVLGAEVRRTSWSLLRLIITANKRYFKKTTMQDLDAELDLLRSQVRLAHELGFLPLARYEHWARLNDEIGCLLGGWIAAQRQPDAGDAG